MIKRDEDLMIEYKSGNMDALEEIFQRYKKRLLNYALRLLSNLADAEDAVGEVFFSITAHKHYEPKAKFSTWIYTIAHNVCIDRMRKRKKFVFLWTKRSPGSDYEHVDLPDPKPRQDDELERKDREHFVKMAVNRLPAHYKEVLILREYQDLSYDDISKVLNCSIDKVKVLIFRARERLRKEMLPLIKEAR